MPVRHFKSWHGRKNKILAANNKPRHQSQRRLSQPFLHPGHPPPPRNAVGPRQPLPLGAVPLRATHSSTGSAAVVQRVATFM